MRNDGNRPSTLAGKAAGNALTRPVGNATYAKQYCNCGKLRRSETTSSRT